MLIEHHGIDTDRILQQALGRGGHFADVYVEEVRSSAIVVDARRLESVDQGISFGVGVRVLHAEGVGYASGSLVDLETLVDLGRAAAFTARGEKFPLRQRPAVVQQKRCVIDARIADAGLQEKIALCREAEAAALALDPKVASVRVIYVEAVKLLDLVNSQGEWVQDEQPRVRLVVSTTVDHAGRQCRGDHIAAGLQGLELFDAFAPREIGEIAARRALINATARPAPAGYMPVVLAAEAGGAMVHEAVGHGLEVDFIHGELSVYTGKVGAQIASPLVTVVDDATIAGQRGSYGFDDEGVAAQRTVLIEGGVLKRYLCDRRHAYLRGEESTGNGRRESYACPPLVRMSNTLIAPGKSTSEEILRETEEGLLVKNMGGGEVDPTSGNFVFEVTEGYLIRKGAQAEAVRGATIAGNGPEVLQLIDRVGSDLGFGPGTCSKEHQDVAVSSAQPTVRVPRLLVGGGEG